MASTALVGCARGGAQAAEPVASAAQPSPPSAQGAPSALAATAADAPATDAAGPAPEAPAPTSGVTCVLLKSVSTRSSTHSVVIAQGDRHLHLEGWHFLGGVPLRWGWDADAPETLSAAKAKELLPCAHEAWDRSEQKAAGHFAPWLELLEKIAAGEPNPPPKLH